MTKSCRNLFFWVLIFASCFLAWSFCVSCWTGAPPPRPWRAAAAGKKALGEERKEMHADLYGGLLFGGSTRRRRGDSLAGRGNVEEG